MPRTQQPLRNMLMDFLLLVAIFAGYYILMTVLLPKLGVQT